MSDMTRTAECACGRVQVTVQNEPLAVAICHCDFCQKRTGSVFQVGAYYARDEEIDVSGETKRYNGLEIDGVGNAAGDSVTYHFCPTCGSTLYWHKEARTRSSQLRSGILQTPNSQRRSWRATWKCGTIGCWPSPELCRSISMGAEARMRPDG